MALLPLGLTLPVLFIWTLTLNAISIVSKLQLTLLIMIILILSQDLCGTGLPEIHALLSWPPRFWDYHPGLPSCPSHLLLIDSLREVTDTLKARKMKKPSCHRYIHNCTAKVRGFGATNFKFRVESLVLCGMFQSSGCQS